MNPNRHYDPLDANHAHAYADGELVPTCDPIMDEEDALRADKRAMYREAALRLMTFHQDCMAFIRRHRSPLLALDCCMLAMGWYHIIGCNDETTLAHRYGVTKQNVSKCVKTFQAQVGFEMVHLVTGAGQRSLAARKSFKTARLKQLKNPHEK